MRTLAPYRSKNFLFHFFDKLCIIGSGNANQTINAGIRDKRHGGVSGEFPKPLSAILRIFDNIDAELAAEIKNMYRGYNLTISDWTKIASNRNRAIDKLASIAREANEGNAADTLFDQHSNIVRNALEEFIDKRRQNKLDGSKLREHWFPQIEAQIFISHSHGDQANAKKLAGYLKTEFELNSFIDSCVWGHANDLLKLIDKDYCWSELQKTYDYDKRNGSTSHVHMMLTTALGEMLDSTECVMFLNTPNSVTSELAVSKTNSPWIYFELGMMRVLRERLPDRENYKKSEMIENFASKQASLGINYKVYLDALIDINVEKLNRWSYEMNQARNTCFGSIHPLDYLYERIAPRASGT